MDVCVKCELASINSCKHKFCFSCIEKWADRENTCPLCKERFTKIERVHKPPSRKRKGDNSSATPPRQRNTKRVKNRSQRSDFISSNAFQGLLGEFALTLCLSSN
jgi:predicted amidophosphoribosyltransferase